VGSQVSDLDCIVDEEIVDLWLRIDFLPAFREAPVCAGMATCGWMASLVGEAGRGRADAPSDGLPSKLCATRRARRRVQRMAEGDIPRSANPTRFWSRQDTSTSAAKGRPFGLLLW
jgi:hypothetical protein